MLDKVISLTAAAILALGATAGLAQAEAPYDLEVLAGNDGALYFGRGADGAMAAIWTDEDEGEDAARFYEGREAEREYRERAGRLPAFGEDLDDPVIKLFGLSIYAEDNGEEGDVARVQINRGGGKKIIVDARDDGDENDAAHIQLLGSNGKGARDFIDDIEDAPRYMLEDMKAALGL